MEFFFIVAGSDTHIFRHAAAEGVSADVNTAPVEVETEQFHHVQAQLALGIDLERALGNEARFLSLPGDHFLQQVG
ncbi:hypothetical protein D3C80_1988670 [compost metagenome]